MIRAFIVFVALVLAGYGLGAAIAFYTADVDPPVKTETLTCVRVKEVTPAGMINYLCEVRK